MTGSIAPRGWALRPEDPRRLGSYELTARLGEGGMGRVYLGRSPTGALVAVKMIRTDVAKEEEFRRRFRGEVARARQVPPFCTAEVLDADPDHDPPYLVTEYVDGPDLGTVVRERGPLSAANLYGLAIGVATALTAIHGAGVIHRDLKASNVLLAPGSPKVIDFGIAREVDTTARHTSTGELIGTVAYMAPERLEPAGRELTPAADIFAWGVVVAYAGTGRVPFRADSLPAMAVCILTVEPDLTGLAPDLRELVAEALAKDPGHRPTARDVLDRLLVTGRPGTARAAGAPATDAELLRTGRRRAQVDPAAPAAGTEAPTAAVGAGTTRVDAAGGSQAPTVAGAAGNASTEVRDAGLRGSPARSSPPARPARTAPLGSARARGDRRRSTRTLIAIAVIAVLFIGGVAGVVSRVIPLPLVVGPAGSANAAPTSSAPASPLPAGVPSGAQLIVRDALTAPGHWEPRDDPENETTCGFDQGLLVTSNRASYRCPGPQDVLFSLAVFADVTLVEAGSCASVWFRFTLADGGYVLRVCQDGYHLATHGTPEPRNVKPLRTFRQEVPVGAATRVGVAAEGTTLRFYRDGAPVGEWSDDTFSDGYVGLGLLQMRAEDRPPYRVRFANVEIWGRGA